MIFSWLNCMVIFNMISADISQKSADVILKRTLKLSHLKISQHCFKKGHYNTHTYKIGDKTVVAWIWFLEYLFMLIWQKKLLTYFPYCHPYLMLYLACSLVIANFEARISTYGLQLCVGNFIVVWVEINPEGQLHAWNWEKALL